MRPCRVQCSAARCRPECFLHCLLSGRSSSSLSGTQISLFDVRPLFLAVPVALFGVSPTYLLTPWPWPLACFVSLLLPRAVVLIGTLLCSQHIPAVRTYPRRLPCGPGLLSHMLGGTDCICRSSGVDCDCEQRRGLELHCLLA